MTRLASLLLLAVVTFGWLYLAWLSPTFALGLGLTCVGLIGLGALGATWAFVDYGLGGDVVWVGKDD